MMIGSLFLFDCVLGFALIAVAMGMLLGGDLFRSIVLFILFGLLLTFAWCRLEAVDVALAEAGIGAGLTGALLLNTWAATGRESGSPPEPLASDRTLLSKSIFAVLIVVPFLLAASAMAAFIVPLTVVTDTPRIAMDEALARSGVTHPVTAVLLNIRAYDTLLEVAVLLAAALAVFPLTVSHKRSGPAEASQGSKDETVAVGVVLKTFTKLLVPVAALVAAYLLWTGTKAPGGAFQSAALLCAIGVLLLVSGWHSPKWTKFRWRLLMAVGLFVFLLVGLLGAFGNSSFLEYPTAWAGPLILLVEFCLTVSLTVILISLFTSTSPADTSPSVAGSATPDNEVATAIHSTQKVVS